MSNLDVDELPKETEGTAHSGIPITDWKMGVMGLDFSCEMMVELDFCVNKIKAWIH